MLARTRSPDLLRRFTPTPFRGSLNVMGRLIHVETNSLAVLKQIGSHLGEYSGSPPKRPNFAWRIVSEESSPNELGWPEMVAFSRDGLSYAGIGPRGFLAVDSLEREAVAFLPEELANDRFGFSHAFLAMLFSLTSEALGLTAIRAACVARGKTGLLIFGPSKSGKTVNCYRARHLGLEFHADEVVFLEVRMPSLRAWGEFWPALFYEDAQLILPELPTIARPFRYRARTYFSLEKPGPRGTPRSVTPAACIFLEKREGEVQSLTRLPADAFRQRLRECSRLWAGASVQLEDSMVGKLLCRLPAFHLAYGSDPSVPSRVFRALI
jgi:hypothetical protein